MATVRPAALADAERIGEIHIRSWQEAYLGILPEAFLASLSVEARVAFWRSDLAAMGEGDLALVIENGSSVNGFARLATSADRNHGEVQAIYLDPVHWRKGWGRTLMVAAEDSLSGLGWSEAILWVLEKNLPARRFYEALGWQSEPRRALLNIGGADVQEIRYHKVL
ncbi:MAG TPA: GNAT family N-acetyltransferase [Acidimicrobiia bacterium]|nr:GNAT family N-acetyltransferase [Acidimicrobiia bacterium]